MTILETKVTIVPETDDALLVLERMDEGFYAVDEQWRFLYINASAERFWGLDRKDMLGKSMMSLFSHFEGSAAYEAHVAARNGGKPLRIETISTATGAPVELRLFPGPTGLSVYFQDITRQRKMEQDLRMRDELLTLAETSAGIGIWVGDLEAQTVMATPEFFRLLGIEPIEGPIPVDFPRTFRHPDDRDRITEGFKEALARGDDTFDSEYRIIRPSGEERWIFGRGRIARDSNGKPWRYSGVDIDVTERKAQDLHLRVVMKELLHRTNNLLAVVQGLARQTAGNSRDLKEFSVAFDARLRGLSESSRLLAQQDWRGAPLLELVRGQVAPFADAERFDFEGPDILLPPKTAQNLGLAFHELCTNAMKYGALSVPDGRVRVEWRRERGGTEQGLHIKWTERGGPPVVPPKRAGFGRVVCEQLIASALGASVTTGFENTGVEWVARLPESALLEPTADDT